MAKEEKKARCFNTSLKHDKNGNEIDIKRILLETKGVHDIYGIEHKTNNEEEKHTHFIIICKTPSTLKTIANIFNVDEHMINYTTNKRYMLRYLIHLDQPEKEQYLPEEVFTNSNISYLEQIGKYEITNKMIVNDILFSENMYNTIMKYIDLIEPNQLNSLIRIAKAIKDNTEIKYLKK